MNILPQSALFVILQWWSSILDLVSAVWMEQHLARYQKHWLVKAHDLLDFAPLEQACADFHVNDGRGAPVIHSVPRLVRAIFLKYLHALSLRQTEEWLDNHLLFKWFAGYGLFDRPPDHSTLDRFELWLFRTNPTLFFDEIVRLIDRLCPEDRGRLQIIDTFATHARVARTHLIELIRDICRNLLTTLEKTAPLLHADLSAQLDLIALFGPEDEIITPALSRPERTTRLQLVARQAFRLHRLLVAALDQPPLLPPDQQAPLRLGLAHLAKILADETTADPLDPDTPADIAVKELPKNRKGSYRIAAAADPEATYRIHDTDAEAILGYNTTVVTSAFVREIHADTGAQPDNLGLPIALKNQFERHGFFPDGMIGDKAYGHGKTRHTVNILTHGQTQIFARIPAYDQRSDRFGPDQFRLTDDGLSLTCPNEVTTSRRYPTTTGGGVDFRFPAKLCRACPLWNQCRGPDSGPRSHRTIFISFYRDELEAARLFNQTDTFKAGIKQRMGIERIIFNLTNLHGARQAHSYGQARTDYQLNMQAAAFNLRQLVREMDKKKAAGGGVCPAAA